LEQKRTRILELSEELSRAMAVQGMDPNNEISGHEKASDGQAPHGTPKDWQ
jgi:hypothetical protein